MSYLHFLSTRFLQTPKILNNLAKQQTLFCIEFKYIRIEVVILVTSNPIINMIMMRNYTHTYHFGLNQEYNQVPKRNSSYAKPTLFESGV